MSDRPAVVPEAVRWEERTRGRRGGTHRPPGGVPEGRSGRARSRIGPVRGCRRGPGPPGLVGGGRCGHPMGATRPKGRGRRQAWADRHRDAEARPDREEPTVRSCSASWGRADPIVAPYPSCKQVRAPSPRPRTRHRRSNRLRVGGGGRADHDGFWFRPTMPTVEPSNRAKTRSRRGSNGRLSGTAVDA